MALAASARRVAAAVVVEQPHCGLIGGAVGHRQAAQLSALWARFPVPVIGAGDPHPVGPTVAPAGGFASAGTGSKQAPASAASSPRPCFNSGVLGSVAIAVRPRGAQRCGRCLVAATAAAYPARAGVGFGRMQGVAAGSALSW